MAINGEEVPVIWGNNDAVAALREQVSRGAIEVETSPYDGFEQVGSLGKSYPAQDISMTTQCGDIVLYGGSNIVLFYGSNTWPYTQLGRYGRRQHFRGVFQSLCLMQH